MKRALFCVWMVLALGWCTAWAETDWPPMTAEVMDDERFSIVEEGETRFLRYERKQGDTWATIWENDAILPDGELGWIKADANYPADGRTAALEVFLEEVRAGLAEFPEVKVSLVTTASAAAGGAVESGQTAALLERADRVLVRLGEGETLPRLNQTPVVPVLEQAGQAREDWAVLAMTGE